MNSKYPDELEVEQLDDRPGHESDMSQKPVFEGSEQRSFRQLEYKVALITGGDSGIGRATAVAFAKAGADIAISYLNEDEDAEQTKKFVEHEGAQCLLLKGDITNEDFCKEIIEKTVTYFEHLDILVNNAAEQHPQESIQDISSEQFERTFRTNVFSMFYLTKEFLEYAQAGSTIINTASVVAFKGKPELIDYSATKGAVLAFTRSLALSLADKNIRVNAVAPGPIWTPLIPSTFDEKEVQEFGQSTALGRPGQPEEVAPAYLYLASNESSYVTGQTIHVNGGEVVNA